MSNVRRLGFRTVRAEADAPRRVRRNGLALRPMPHGGRGIRDGCRGRNEDERCKRASHLPITVNVSVAV